MYIVHTPVGEKEAVKRVWIKFDEAEVRSLTTSCALNTRFCEFIYMSFRCMTHYTRFFKKYESYIGADNFF